MKNSAPIRIFSFKRFLRLVMGLLLFSNCMLSSDLLDPDEAYVALVCYERVPDPMEDRFECGDGSMDHPFVIAKPAQLMVLQSNNSLWAPGRYFDVVRNLDLGGIAWQPIGDSMTQFKGTFRGLRPNDQPVQISNLRINQPVINDPANKYLGFFGWVSGATIENVGMENVDITGNQYLGGLVGRSNDTGATINNCYATGVIEGNNNIGGLLGRGDGTTGITIIENSYSTVNVTGTGDNIGGLLGRGEEMGTGITIIENSYATGTVTGNNAVGGLVGRIVVITTTISNSYATGIVMGNARVGGLVGHNNNPGTIENSYSTGTVTGTGGNIGGLVGESNNAGRTIENSYATGNVRSLGMSDHIGGLIGFSVGIIKNSYATGDVSGAGNRIGGLLGWNNGGTISNSYATGTVMGTGSLVGGLMGLNGATATITGTNYFVSNPSGIITGLGSGTCAGTCAQRTLEQLRSLDETSAFTPPWPSSSWTRLNQPGFPCIATITFGRGGCPP